MFRGLDLSLNQRNELASGRGRKFHCCVRCSDRGCPYHKPSSYRQSIFELRVEIRNVQKSDIKKIVIF